MAEVETHDHLTAHHHLSEAIRQLLIGTGSIYERLQAASLALAHIDPAVSLSPRLRARFIALREEAALAEDLSLHEASLVVEAIWRFAAEVDAETAPG